MKKLPLSALDRLFAAIAGQTALYIPADDAKGQAQFTLWTRGLSLTSKLNTVRSAKDLFFPQVENLVNFKVEFDATNYDGEKQIKYYTIADTKGDALWVEFNSVEVWVDGVKLDRGYYHGIAGTHKTLGIIPCGSGDGLALHLGISRKYRTALKTIMAGKTVPMDAATVNGRPFFSVCGIGFDAVVSERFAKSGK